ncbi:MAG: LytR family transcriptional regulator [Lachnospiraceae bacterium]|nr:LytR family transcriptional regulator [Lachnospiraceae bacterium]
MKKFSKIISMILVIAVVFCIAGCSKKEVVSVVTTTQETVEVTTEAPAPTETEAETTTEEETTTLVAPTEPIDFVIFGCDTQSVTPVDDRRSDLIKIVRIDPRDETIKFIGILRDTKVPIEGHDPQKINGAFMYGGADLALKTINENFGLDLHKYIMINFANMIWMVDDIGGVEVEISDEEAVAINKQAADFTGQGRMETTTELEEGGLVTLNGVQALAFCRTRKIDSDYFRSARQNKVLKAIIQKLKDMPAEQYPQIIDDLFRNTETNMTLEDITVWTIMNLGDYEFSGYMVPDENYEYDVYGGVDDSGSWVWNYDTLEAGERIKSILDGTFEPLDSQNEYGEADTIHDGIEKGSLDLEKDW